jgi:N-acetylneuraminic acid mutarotase
MACFASRTVTAAVLASHLFPHKDGEAGYHGSGNQNHYLDLVSSRGKYSTLAWITYQTGGVELGLTSGSALTLYLDKLHSGGTLKVFALTAPVNRPENRVRLDDLSYHPDSPVAAIGIDDDDEEKVLRIDLSDLLAKGAFHGLVLEAHDGLKARFGSKDSDLQPLIELRYAFATPEQVNQAIEAGQQAQAAATAANQAADDAEAAAAAAGASSLRAQGYATLAGQHAVTAAGSATQAGTYAAEAETSASEAAASAGEAATSATSAAGSAAAAGTAATEASGYAASAGAAAGSCATSAAAAEGSASSAADFADAAAASAAEAASQSGGMPTGGSYFSTSPVPPDGFFNTGVRINNGEYPWTFITGTGTGGRYGMGHTTYHGRLHITGGDGGKGVGYNLHQAFNPATAAWTTLAPLPTTMAMHSLSEVDGMLYAIGGRDILGTSNNVRGSTYRYNPATDSWTTMAPIPTARHSHMTVAHEGKIHVFGGNASVSSLAILSSHQIYDVASNTWSTGTPLPAALTSGTVSEVNGKFYIIGGVLPSGTYSDAVIIYEPATDTYSQGAPMPQGVRGVHSAAVANGLIYVIGGYRTSYLADGEQYDPNGNTWVPIAPLNQARAYAAAGFLNGRIYIVGGQTGTSYFNSAEQYSVPMTLFAIQKQ